jgi:hypothetical protein
LAANQHFRRSIENNPDAPVVLLSCHGDHSTVSPSGDARASAAQRAAEQLHRAGINRDVYASKVLAGMDVHNSDFFGRQVGFADLMIDTKSPASQALHDPIGHYPAPESEGREHNGRE